MSTDTPYAWGVRPPWDDPEADKREAEVDDIVREMSADMKDIFIEAIESNIHHYTNRDFDFKNEVLRRLIQKHVR